MNNLEVAKEGLGEMLDTIEAGCLALIGTLSKEKPALGKSKMMKAISESKDILSSFVTNRTIEEILKSHDDEKERLNQRNDEMFRKLREAEEALRLEAAKKKEAEAEAARQEEARKKAEEEARRLEEACKKAEAEAKRYEEEKK